MKSADYKDNPHSLLELKEATENFIWKIAPVELLHVFGKKLRCVDAFLQGHGANFQHLLFSLV
jgi:hypothetical protein